MRILIAEDDPISRRLLEVTLGKWGYEVMSCPDGESAWAMLQQPGAPSLAILDWMMPGMDGLQVCREVRQMMTEPYTYMLLLPAKSQKADIIAGLEAGADDYLTKPFDASELRMRLRAGRRILDLQAELIFVREELRTQATHDSLTRLLNRAATCDILQRELERAEREQLPLSIILADIDFFKRINDTYGHLAGDAVLRETSQNMKAVVRPYDGIGRYGGEEFLLVLPGCDNEGAATLAERIRESIESNPLALAEGIIPITLSLGVASNDITQNMEGLIGAADAALYRAKNNGRNRVEIAAHTDTLEDGVLTFPLSPSSG
ncbi:GGDEF domain-containing response regulator [Candidatus Entotheonella palauensis]|uniref:GGDEF domain-containing response regulator n=1 Tax=Candidatus Entotheonella palauensis TaxID=93172 RepID=UPI000B7D02C9|nr:diguanylate cyclase [Candidatus Entotheonella palauensis]